MDVDDERLLAGDGVVKGVQFPHPAHKPIALRSRTRSPMLVAKQPPITPLKAPDWGAFWEPSEAASIRGMDEFVDQALEPVSLRMAPICSRIASVSQVTHESTMRPRSTLYTAEQPAVHGRSVGGTPWNIPRCVPCADR